MTRLVVCARCYSSEPKSGDKFCKQCIGELVRGADTRMPAWILGELSLMSPERLRKLYYGEPKENPMPSEKTTPVPDELLRKLKASRADKRAILTDVDGVASAIDALPSPPPLDPVEEAIRVFDEGPYHGRKQAMTKALQRYRELGCPEIP